MSIKAILTDVTKCIGCLECVAACKVILPRFGGQFSKHVVFFVHSQQD